jgi:hypothetical protein
MARSVVFGIFSTKDQVETAVAEMQRDGFRNADISVLFPCSEDTKHFALEKDSTAPEGTEAGTTSGEVIGGALGSLGSIGVLANPGLGPFIAAGPIMALLSDTSTGTVIGGLTGALIRIGIPEYVARPYARRIRRGWTLLSVHADDSKWIRKARKVFTQTGADDIAFTGETKSDYANAQKSARRASEVISNL